MFGVFRINILFFIFKFVRVRVWGILEITLWLWCLFRFLWEEIRCGVVIGIFVVCL